MCCVYSDSGPNLYYDRSRNWRNAMVEPPLLPHGTTPLGASSEQDASRRVREMFTRITPRYDFLNHLLSAQMDRVWRNRTAGTKAESGPQRRYRAGSVLRHR